MRTDEVLRTVRDRMLEAPAYGRLSSADRHRMARNLDQLVEAGHRAESHGLSTPAAPKAKAPSTVPARDASTTFGNLVDQVDFVGFTSKLLHGVFDAIVDSSQQQMQAYAEMLESVVMSTKDFAQTHVSDADARSNILSSFSGMLDLDPNGKFVGNPGKADAIQSQFGISHLDSQEAQDALVEQGRLRLAEQRQQMLATMVLMGINRIIVTDGNINAKVTFHIQTDARTGQKTNDRSRSVSMRSGDTRDTEYHLDPNYQGQYPICSGEDDTSGSYVYKLQPGRYDIAIDAGLPPAATPEPAGGTTVLNCPKWGIRYLRVPKGWTINFYGGDANWTGPGGYPAIADSIPHVTYTGPLELKYPDIAFNRNWHNFMIVSGPSYTTTGFGVKLSTSTQDPTTLDAAELSTRATLKGAVDLDFASQVFPLDKLAPDMRALIEGIASDDPPTEAPAAPPRSADDPS